MQTYHPAPMATGGRRRLCQSARIAAPESQRPLVSAPPPVRRHISDLNACFFAQQARGMAVCVCGHTKLLQNPGCGPSKLRQLFTSG